MSNLDMLYGSYQSRKKKVLIFFNEISRKAKTGDFPSEHDFGKKSPSINKLSDVFLN